MCVHGRGGVLEGERGKDLEVTARAHPGGGENKYLVSTTCMANFILFIRFLLSATTAH